MAQQVENLTRCPWGCEFDPWPRSVGYGSGVAARCSIVCRCILDLVLLWLGYSPAAATLIWPLAQKITHASHVAVKKKKMNLSLPLYLYIFNNNHNENSSSWGKELWKCVIFSEFSWNVYALFKFVKKKKKKRHYRALGFRVQSTEYLF